MAAALLHDIGYAEELIHTGLHPLDGVRFLAGQATPERVCALVAHHLAVQAVADLSGLSAELAAFPDEHTVIRDALWYCDSTVGAGGEPVKTAWPTFAPARAPTTPACAR